MSLAKKFDERLKRNTTLRAVWLPGTKVQLGDILRIKNGVFESIAKLSDYEITFEKIDLSDILSIKFQAQGVSYQIIQGEGNVDLKNINMKAAAELKISFNSEDSYFIRTPELEGEGISNIIKLSKQIAKITNWDFRNYFIAWNIWSAKEFIFLGSTSKNTSVKFKGDGQAINNLLNTGISSNVSYQRESKISFEIIGASGPLAMKVFRVKRNGEFY